MVLFPKALALTRSVETLSGRNGTWISAPRRARRPARIAVGDLRDEAGAARTVDAGTARDRRLGHVRQTLLSLQQHGQWFDEQMANNLAATETDRGLVMTLGDVLFDAGRAELKTSANRTVLKLVQFLQLNPRRIVRIEGYTDGRGDAAENLELSRARAQAVADVLVDLGIDSQRISVKGFGEDHAIADNASSRGRAQNRRVEIVFSDETGQLQPGR